MQDIYVIGHKNPDTDSVISAIAVAEIMGYKPAIAGEINRETAFILESFGVSMPELIKDISGKKVFLVDHNENTQIADGWDEAEIIGVIDHHKINFSSAAPLFFHIETLGSTCSLVAKMHMNIVQNNPRLAGILLAGILSDTIIFKSPTTTEEDREIALCLMRVANISDMIELGIKIKMAGANIAGKTVRDIVSADFKDFDMNGRKIGIGQIELPDIAIVKEMEADIIAHLSAVKESGYELVVMVVTDIMAGGSKLFFAGDSSIIEKSFNVATNNNSVFMDGLMSRKKQIVPPLEAFFK